MSLKGNTTDFPLDVLLRLFADQKKTGELVLRGTQGEGALGLAEGRVITAVYGDEPAIPALGAVFDIGVAEFEFTPWNEAPSPNLEGDLQDNLKKADEHKKWLASVREVIPDDRLRFRLSERAAEHGAVTFTSDRWRVVLAVNGQRDVNDLAAHLHIEKNAALDLLAGLVRDGVIEAIEPPAGEPGAMQPPPPAAMEPAPQVPPPTSTASAPDWSAALLRDTPVAEPEPARAPEPTYSAPEPTYSTPAPMAPEPEPTPAAPPEPAAPTADPWAAAPEDTAPAWSAPSPMPAPAAPPSDAWSAAPPAAEWSAPPPTPAPAPDTAPAAWSVPQSAPAPEPAAVSDWAPAAPIEPAPEWTPPVPAEPEPVRIEPAPLDDRLAALFGSGSAASAPPPAEWTMPAPATDQWITPGATEAAPAEDPRLAPMAMPPAAAVTPPNEWAPPPPSETAAPQKKRGLFGFGKREAVSFDRGRGAAVAESGTGSRIGQLAAFSNALLNEYNSGKYGKARVDDRIPSLLMRVDEQADPIDRPLPVVDDRLDVQAMERVALPEAQAVPYLAFLVSTIYGDAEKAFGRDKAKKGYKAAHLQLFGGDASALAGPDLAGKLPKV